MALQDDLDTALARAVRIAGSQVAFGKLIGKRQSVVRDWLRYGRLLPLEHVLTIEAATGVPRHELRPDLADLVGANPVAPNQASGAVPAAPAPGVLADEAGAGTVSDPAVGEVAA